MTPEQTLIERGAESACGDLILKGKVMGRYRHGGFVLTEDGIAELDVIEVPAIEVQAPKARKAKAVEAQPEPEAS